MREVLGLSHFQKTDTAPVHFKHEKPDDVKQEDDLIKLMNAKDDLYSHIKFESEQNAFDANRSIDYSKINPVTQPLINKHYRKQLHSLGHNGKMINTAVHHNMVEKLVFRATAHHSQRRNKN